MLAWPDAQARGRLKRRLLRLFQLCEAAKMKNMSVILTVSRLTSSQAGKPSGPADRNALIGPFPSVSRSAYISD